MMAFPHIFRRWTIGALCGLALAGALARGADEPDAQTEQAQLDLKDIVNRQQTLLQNASKPGFKLDDAVVKLQFETICREYDLLTRDHPNFAPAYAAYGYLLRRLDMRKQSMVMLLKANQLNPNDPLVKNQLGNFLAEDGKPLEAVNYFVAAVKLAPKEPLYHYALGTLLYEARDDFLKNGVYTQEQLETAVHQAFKTAAELAPDRIEFTYRYAESFYDLTKPDWEGALRAWAALEERAPTPIERETMRLQAANVLIKQGKFDLARVLLSTVTEPDLAATKEKLIAQLPEKPKQ